MKSSYFHRRSSNHSLSLFGVYCCSYSQAASVYVLFLHKPTERHNAKSEPSVLHKWTTECASAADFCLAGRVYCRHQRNGYFLRAHEELFNVWIEVSHNNNKKLCTVFTGENTGASSSSCRWWPLCFRWSFVNYRSSENRQGFKKVRAFRIELYRELLWPCSLKLYRWVLNSKEWISEATNIAIIV